MLPPTMSKYVHTVIPRTYEYVTSPGKKDLADVIKNVSQGSLWVKEQGRRVRQVGVDWTRGQSDENLGGKAGTKKHRQSLWESSSGTSRRNAALLIPGFLPNDT